MRKIKRKGGRFRQGQRDDNGLKFLKYGYGLDPLPVGLGHQALQITLCFLCPGMMAAYFRWQACLFKLLLQSVPQDFSNRF
jgi:hypothetical protein